MSEDNNNENVDDIFASYSPEQLRDFYHYAELLDYCDPEDVEALKQRMNEMSWREREGLLKEESTGGQKK